jgi:DNA repair exonuclease SbcCD ATPase subunit
MPGLPEMPLLTPEEEELQCKKARLAQLEAQLTDRELELTACLADLNHFERHYLQSVGRRYALIDDLKAKIAEARARQNPHSRDAREQARQARSQARASAWAAGEEYADATPPDGAASPPRAKRSESLDKLYRQAARLLHPDLTLDGDEKKHRHRLMAELNDAYARGDEDGIRAILRDWHASPENVAGDGPGAELIRVIRKIAQVEKRLKAIAAGLDRLRQGELFKLKQQVEDAHANGRDLLKDLGERLDWEIDTLRQDLERVISEAKS